MSTAYRMYIHGEWIDHGSRGTRDVPNPVDQSIIASTPYGGKEEAIMAIRSARDAFRDWSRNTTVYERASCLRKTADLIRRRARDIAGIITREVGKTLPESEGETLAAAHQFEWYAEEIKRPCGDLIPSQTANKRLFTLRHPVGVVAAIAPWNFPVLLIARKIAPAMAAGCTTVSKPAPKTPLCTVKLFECLHDAGLPKGVANLIIGDAEEIGEEFLTNPIVKKISFTGSVRVGKILMEKGARQLKKLSLELGGHAPVVVFPDVDVDKAAQACVTGKFRNMGQVCISPSRFYIHEDIYEAFKDRAVKLAGSLRIGNGLDPDTDVGPMCQEENRRKTIALLEDAVSKGAKILTGGRIPQGSQYAKGSFFQPTVLENTPDDARLCCDEVFGPIMPLFPFHDVDKVIDKANHPRFGLAAYVLTNDIATGIKMAEALEYGIIGLNDTVPATAQCPFGGMKESGMGREGARDGLEAYMETKYVSLGLA